MSVRSRVLHAVRILGYADSARVSERAVLAYEVAREELLDAQASGQVSWGRFEDEGGWSLTEDGRIVGEAFLAAELDAAGARSVVESVLIGFEPLNELVCGACTRWQLAETGIRHEASELPDVVAELSRAVGAWTVLEERLSAHLPRFAGYHARLVGAIQRASTDPTWVTGLHRDSVHRVWFELHEDLLATAGRSR